MKRSLPALLDHTGEVNIVFYDSSIDPDSNNFTQVTLARTTNGSLLTEDWRHYQISDFAWIPVPVPSTPEGFAGEYIGLASNSRYVVPVWNDNRTGLHEVYVARFPIERTTVHSTLQARWNMKSVPVIRDDFGAASVFPSSSVYRYESPNYVLSDTLTCNRGYWVNTPQHQSIIHEGGIVEMMGMPVVPGGNIVGSITSPVPAATVWSNPPGILTNPVFYRYENGGYHPSKTLQPGEAYWVLANAPGTIYLEAGFSNDPTIDDILAEYDRFTITDSAGNSQDIYVRNGSMVTPGDIDDLEMPPPPPEVEFAARFATGQFLRTVDPIAVSCVSISQWILPNTL